MNQHSIDRFVSRLEKLAGLAGSEIDRAAMAALRRTLSTWPAVPPGAMRVVAPFLDERTTRWRETIYYLIAGLFAMHPDRPETKRSLAGSLREAIPQNDSKPSQGPERRLLSLLNCQAEDVREHLRHVVAYLRSRKEFIDYRQLMTDLDSWDSTSGKVQRRWGRDFWGARRSQQTEESKTKEETNVH